MWSSEQSGRERGVWGRAERAHGGAGAWGPHNAVHGRKQTKPDLQSVVLIQDSMFIPTFIPNLQISYRRVYLLLGSLVNVYDSLGKCVGFYEQGVVSRLLF